jgi:hypothetical protein
MNKIRQIAVAIFNVCLIITAPIWLGLLFWSRLMIDIFVDKDGPTMRVLKGQIHLLDEIRKG